MKKNLVIVFAVFGLFLLSSTSVSAQCVAPEGFMWKTMWGGQTMYVGEYQVQTIGNMLNIQVYGVDGWLLQDVHVSVVTDPADFPVNNGGNPKLNEFPWRSSMMPTAVPWDVTIPFDFFDPDLVNGQTVYIMIHTQFVKLDSFGNIIDEETAFNGECGTSGWTPLDPWPCWMFQLSSARWAYYVAFTL